MPFYREMNLLFIHIPKTGGENIGNELNKYSSRDLYSGFTNTLLDPPHNLISLQHQFYTTLYQFRNKLNLNFDNIKIFSIVRNPYYRIISDLFWHKLIEEDFDSDQVYDVIRNNYLHRNDLDNHNIPQYKFITDENLELVKNIKIFKTENLNESNKEIANFTGVNINIYKKITKKDLSKYLNKKSIYLINNFYKKDFELFNYKFKSEFKQKINNKLMKKKKRSNS